MVNNKPIYYIHESANHMGDSKKFLSVKELMQFLGICKTSVYNHVKSGKLKSYRIGGRVLFDKDEVEKAIKSTK